MNSGWMMAAVFLAVSVPTVLLLQELDWGGDFRLLLAMGAGALASGVMRPRGGASSKPSQGDKP